MYIVDVILHFLHVEEVLLFFKFYDPTSRTISYIGHSVENIEKKFSEWFLHFSTHISHVLHVGLYTSLSLSLSLPLVVLAL